ncbi:hypothetical protein [uncultured Chitinophaga sp.]|uniref:hypothetical protein n=1 Tax=uncultured Chitinophaga sp. TaxID=339340 RepID=UPI0026256C27|nr:hypothetical protein [uncultured Chitinophaga sp.]
MIKHCNYRLTNVSLLFTSLSLTLFSCTVQKPDAPATPALSKNTKILTTGTWVCYEYFNGYNYPLTKLTWKADKTSSYRNLSKIRVKKAPSHRTPSAG